MSKKDNLKSVLGIIIMLSAFAFMIILTIVESIFYIIAIIATVVFILLLYFDNDSDRKVLWIQIVGAPFAFCVAIIVRNLILSLWI